MQFMNCTVKLELFIDNVKKQSAQRLRRSCRVVMEHSSESWTYRELETGLFVFLWNNFKEPSQNPMLGSCLEVCTRIVNTLTSPVIKETQQEGRGRT